MNVEVLHGVWNDLYPTWDSTGGAGPLQQAGVWHLQPDIRTGVVRTSLSGSDVSAVSERQSANSWMEFHQQGAAVAKITGLSLLMLL